MTNEHQPAPVTVFHEADAQRVAEQIMERSGAWELLKLAAELDPTIADGVMVIEDMAAGRFPMADQETT